VQRKPVDCSPARVDDEDLIYAALGIERELLPRFVARRSNLD